MIEFEKELQLAINKRSSFDSIRLMNQIISRNEPIYLIGKNDQSSEIINNYSVAGIIDDTTSSSTHWAGVDIVKTSDVGPTSTIINCSTSIAPIKVRNHLVSSRLINQFHVCEIISETGNPIKLPWFVLEQRKEIAGHLVFWKELFDHLSDETSKKTLLDVVRFRLTADPDYMIDYDVRLQEQYFEDFMNYKNEVFVDAGGYDGDTTEEFVKRYPDYDKVYLYEPSSKNISSAQARLNGLINIHFKAVGLSNESGTFHFNADAGPASSIANGTGEITNFVTLDEDLHNEKVTFIKMDLEGWEINALRGAEKTIRAHKPKLAIAVYHAAKDFRDIYQYVLGIHPDYKVYLRHYTQGWSETVMFFK